LKYDGYDRRFMSQFVSFIYLFIEEELHSYGVMSCGYWAWLSYWVLRLLISACIDVDTIDMANIDNIDGRY